MKKATVFLPDLRPFTYVVGENEVKEIYVLADNQLVIHYTDGTTKIYGNTTFELTEKSELSNDDPF